MFVANLGVVCVGVIVIAWAVWSSVRALQREANFKERASTRRLEELGERAGSRTD